MKSLKESLIEERYYTIEDQAVGAVYALILKGIDGIAALIQKIVEKIDPDNKQAFLTKLRKDLDKAIDRELDGL